MIRLRRLAWALCLALLSINSSVSKAQVDQTTGNLVTNSWTGAPSSTTSVGGFSGGYQPTYNTQTGTLQFGYNQGTASQAIAINSALSAAGVGIQVGGYSYSWSYYNQDMNRGTLQGTINLTNSSGSILSSYNYSMPQTNGGWTIMSGVQNFPTTHVPSSLGYLNVSFTGKDDRFWAGYYGPLIKDIDVKLRYGVDPCASNPTYSPSCPGFNAVVTSNNMVPYPDATAVWGTSINNSYSIQAALSAGDSGLKVHGFDWGYRVHSAEPYCAFWVLVCFDNRDPLARTNVSITNSSGTPLYSITRDYNDINNYQNKSYSHRFPISRNLGNLGNFNFTAETWDDAYVTNMYSRIVYTPDLCMLDPLSSPSCPNYFTSLAKTTPTNTSQPVIETYSNSATNPSNDQVVNSAGIVLTVSEPSNVSQSTPTQQTQSQTTTNAITPSSSNSDQEKKSTPSTSTLLSIIRNIQQNDAAVQKSATQNALSEAAQASTSSQTEALAIANQAVVASVLVTPSFNPGLNIFSSGVGLQAPNSNQLQNNAIKINNEQDVPALSSGFLTNKTDPLNEALESRVQIENSSSDSQGSTVKKNVQSNEAAGGVDIAMLAKQPTGFETYLNSLRDVPFYPPKEIYRNQKTVDNERVLRQLNQRSDKLHSEMVNEQYRTK